MGPNSPASAPAPGATAAAALLVTERTGKLRWGMLALVFFATTLNYVDRAALGLLQPVLAKELHWSAQDYADINFWFQVGYAIGYVLQGRLLDVIGVRRGFALAVLTWSIAAAGHGVAVSLAGFMLSRFILGLCEAGNYPACIRATRLWFPPRERALAVGIFNAGTNVGAMIAPLFIPLMLSVWGWRPVFYVVGALGLVWLWFWWRHYHDPEQHPKLGATERALIADGATTREASAERMSFREVLQLRATWAYAGGHMLTAPVFWFYLYWLPPFLNQQFKLGINVTQLGLPLIVVYAMADVGSIAGGWASSWLVRRGMAPVKARLLSMAICLLGIAPVYLITMADTLWGAVAFLALALAAHQAWTANIWALAIDIAPKPAVASLFGVGGMCAAIGGMFMTQLVGFVLTRSGNDYTQLFMLTPAAYVAALLWICVVKPRKDYSS